MRPRHSGVNHTWCVSPHYGFPGGRLCLNPSPQCYQNRSSPVPGEGPHAGRLRTALQLAPAARFPCPAPCVGIWPCAEQMAHAASLALKRMEWTQPRGLRCRAPENNTPVSGGRQRAPGGGESQRLGETTLCTSNGTPCTAPAPGRGGQLDSCQRAGIPALPWMQPARLEGPGGLAQGQEEYRARGKSLPGGTTPESRQGRRQVQGTVAPPGDVPCPGGSPQTQGGHAEESKMAQGAMPAAALPDVP